METIILLKPEDHYSQRNNTLYPSITCMPTSRVNFYLAAGIEYENPTDMSDDDYFTSLLNTPEAREFAIKKYPWSEGYHPWELHGIYGSYLDKIVTGRRQTDFRQDLTWCKVILEIVSGKPVMTSGKFPGLNGHAFTFIGYDFEAEELIVSDPWGNPHLDYRSPEGKKGYGIRYNKAYFDEHVKPGELKWGHCII